MPFLLILNIQGKALLLALTKAKPSPNIPHKSLQYNKLSFIVRKINRLCLIAVFYQLTKV